MIYSREQIQKALESKKYVWFKEGDLNVNIVGIRNKSTKDNVTDLFDDLITISFIEKGEWKYYEWSITTDPGAKAMQKVTNPTGVAIMVPGQYRSCYYIGLHKGKYEALCQGRPVKVYRDADKDSKFDEIKPEEGLFGINIHRASQTESLIVDSWSEGCQVFKRGADFKQFMEICKRASKIHGNSFTYTLITSDDLS